MKDVEDARISKAAFRRLAHDAHQKLTKQSYETALVDLDAFLLQLVNASLRASTFSRKKSIAREHVLFAVKSMGIQLPQELAEADEHSLKKLQKCNLHAPAQQRKQNALHAEVSEASFSRTSKRIATKCRANLRISSQARRLLQLIAEQRIMAFFASSTNDSPASASADASTTACLQNALGCSEHEAVKMSVLISEISRQMPSLLEISQTKTVDDRLIMASLGTMAPWAVEIDIRQHVPDSRLVRLCDRILRGRAADKRVTVSAAATLASVLTAFNSLSTTTRDESRESTQCAPMQVEPAQTTVAVAS